MKKRLLPTLLALALCLTLLPGTALAVTIHSGDSGAGEAVMVTSVKNGTVTVSYDSDSPGSVVTVTVQPDTGYALETLTATDAGGNQITLTRKSDTVYTFSLPASQVTVRAAFLDDNTMLSFFTDVPARAYCYDAVLWAAEKGVVSGVSDTAFAPNASCTRAQLVTFLWRAAGSPVTAARFVLPFADVSEDAYYYEALRWAVNQGIASGVSGTAFRPDAAVTRGQAVTFLWRQNGSKVVNYLLPFTDVPAEAYYTEALRWAASQGIAAGTSASAFTPEALCTRGQIVTFLYRSAQ